MALEVIMHNSHVIKYNQLAKKMLLSNIDTKKNFVVSPLSFYLLLALLTHATDGNSKQEILDVLGDENGLDDFVAQLKDKNNQLLSANGLCILKDYYHSINKKFILDTDDIYRPEIFVADQFAVDDINEWVNEKTLEMIPKLIDELPKDFVLCLMNALAFKAKWNKKYKPDEIEEDLFNGFNTSKTLTFLTSKEKLYVEDNYFEGFIKDYKKERYAFMALLPKKEGFDALKEAINHLDIIALYQKRKEEDVETKLPEFSIESNFNLNDFTSNLGINDIFTSKANFSPLLNDLPIKVDSIIQKAYIKVDRDGTEAAAITAMMIRLASLSHSHYVYLNRPFIYAIIDKENDGLAPFVGLFLAE